METIQNERKYIMQENNQLTAQENNSSKFLQFSHQMFGNVRAVLIDGECWFVGKDVAKALGYEKTRNAISAHVEEEDKKVAPIQGTLGGTQGMVIINESGVYSLVFSSKLPLAKDFTHWFASEVLPTCQLYGCFIIYKIMKNYLDEPAPMIRVLQNYQAKKKAKVFNSAKYFN